MTQPLRLTEAEKKKLVALIQSGEPLPSIYKTRLFAPEDGSFVQATKEYRLVYDGKARVEDVLAQTPAAPWQLVRSFCTERPHAEKGWRNLLVWGDNLLALRELLADQQGPNRLGTRGKIKLIYIDPPFATRQDFMKDKEKAYRDKVMGAQFLEFLRRRLILLRDLLADDGSIYVHLDWKKGHYIKAVLDEVFGEENFRNEIIRIKCNPKNYTTSSFGNIHDSIFFFSKSETTKLNRLHEERDEKQSIADFPLIEQATGRRYTTVALHAKGIRSGSTGQPWRGIMPPNGRHWAYVPETLEELDSRGLIEWSSSGNPRAKRYADEDTGKAVQTIWEFKDPGDRSADYATQKPEALLERIIKASSNEGDIVLDCFSGSGTTAAVAEKLARRWIAMDCGKLAIYTAQKRLFSLSTNIVAAKAEAVAEQDRVKDWGEHLNSAPGILLITEKARKGESDITLEFLYDLATLAKKHGLIKKDAALSLACPAEKLLIPPNKLQTTDEGPGEKLIKLDGVEFRISLIDAKGKPARERPLSPREFALYRAGIYDNEAVKQLPWGEYRPFVLKLFQVREHPHKIRGVQCDGYVGVYSAVVWNYPDFKKLTLDYDYAKSLHEMLCGNGGDRFYVIAPIVSMGFAEDEYTVGDTTYVFLKVPISILMRLLQSGHEGTLRQPTKEADINEVIDAVGFDFISQPEVTWKCKKERSPETPLLKDYTIQVTEFRSKTLATDPEDFANFETLSMGMVDTCYDGKVFKLTRVFWADNLIAAELKRINDEQKQKKKRSEKEAQATDISKCEQLSLRIPESEFTGKQMLLILCDRYGNEKNLVLSKSDFK
jgi:adenine-specific DNA-methyltransferase